MTTSLPPDIAQLLAAGASEDPQIATLAFGELIERTAQPVPWAAAAWDQLLADAVGANARARALAGALLPRLAHSDPDERIFAALPILTALLRDSDHLTARNTLQNLWRAALPSTRHFDAVMPILRARFIDCDDARKPMEVRTDVVETLGRLMHGLIDHPYRQPLVKFAIDELIEGSPPVARAKLTSAWRIGARREFTTEPDPR